MFLRKSVVALGALTVASLAPAATWAQSQMQDQSGQSTKTTTLEQQSNIPPSQLRQTTLTVLSVDRATHSVIIKAHVSPEADVEKNGVPIRVDQLQPGDSIRASFDPTTNQLVKVQVVQKSPGSSGGAQSSSPSTSP